MADDQSSNWDSLAELLGAEDSPECEPQAELQAPPSRIPEHLQEAQEEAPTDGPEAGWNDLADEFGLEPDQLVAEERPEGTPLTAESLADLATEVAVGNVASEPEDAPVVEGSAPTTEFEDDEDLFAGFREQAREPWAQMADPPSESEEAPAEAASAPSRREEAPAASSKPAAKRQSEDNDEDDDQPRRRRRRRRGRRGRGGRAGEEVTADESTTDRDWEDTDSGRFEDDEDDLDAGVKIRSRDELVSVRFGDEAKAEDSAGDDEDEEARRPRRRRRRRGRRRSESDERSAEPQPKSRKEPARAAFDDEEEDDVGDWGPSFSEDDAGEDPSAEDSVVGFSTVARVEDDSEDEQRPRRRSRRRRRGRREESPPSAPSSDKTAFDDDLEDDELEAPQRGERRVNRHKNIPTWGDAVSVVVETNIEARSTGARQPHGSGRGRGGRGRGRRRN